MEEKSLSENESLLIISQMIERAKSEQKDDGKGWILWGWVLFIASVLTIINLKFKLVETFFFWNVFGLFTILYFAYSSIRNIFFRKVKRVKTYTSELFEKLNVGFFVFLFFIIFSMNLGVSPVKGFPMLIALYAFWVMIHGAALNFKPSIIAAFIMWGIGFGALFANDFRMVMILHALAVLCGYIIPGHIANWEFQRTKKLSV